MIALCKNEILCSFKDLIKFQDLYNNFKLSSDPDSIELFDQGSIFLLVYLLNKIKIQKLDIIYIPVENLFNSFIKFNKGETTNLDLNIQNQPESLQIIFNIKEGTIDTTLKDDLNNFKLTELFLSLQTNIM